MSTGHYRAADPSMTQNQGNSLGDRPCVKQSAVGRSHMGGNAMKDLMGQGDLKWDSNQQQGAYQGNRVVGAPPVQQQQQQQQQYRPQQQQVSQCPWATDDQPVQQQSRPPQQQQQQQQSLPPQQAPAPQGNTYRGRVGAGQANKTSFNLFTGEEHQ